VELGEHDAYRCPKGGRGLEPDPPIKRWGRESRNHCAL